MTSYDSIRNDRDSQLEQPEDELIASSKGNPILDQDGTGARPLPTMRRLPSATNPDPPVVWQQGSGPRASYRHRRQARRDCTHSTVVRFHDDNFVCPNCLCEPIEGYVYHCVEDLELRLNNAIFEDNFVAWDEFGEGLAKLVKPPARGPDRRTTADRQTILAEMTAEQKANYTEEEIEKLVAQRKHALVAARISAAQAGNTSDKPWVLSPRQECDMEFCHSCRPCFAERSYLSLNGIVNGDVPATAALGFGFHAYSSRPLYDPNVTRNLGLRRPPEPFPASHTQFNLMDLIESHLNQLNTYPPPQQNFDFQHSHAVGYPLGSIMNESHEPKAGSGFFGCEVVRPPWTPPPTPPLIECNDQGEAIGGSTVIPHDGRSPISIRGNSFVRQQVFQTVPGGIVHSSADDLGEKIPRNLPACIFEQDRLKYLTEEACDVGLGLPFSQEEYKFACSTMLPPADFDEVFALNDGDTRSASTLVVKHLDLSHDLRPKTKMERIEEEEGHFGENPLQVVDGIALTEEAVQTGTPDIVI
ncbi:hypothetical protein MCOR27_008893 [Pyricularia oryzae]|uniref:Uncharacterized protein n=4 Tax=Pyricularia TaxID=48558 RepID=A0ABQ8N700_PYRGI|nr:uncharacterized protein MGG_05293 [Pyricularia oryzae 70-15]ELQ44941.1 hypothetical protein OOU_Y34scaffold00033g6 [Pyricularia oryzae Y34]KAH8848236.1 hypothetical protein MCOR01_001618 [Pyricularia oryzae]KAI6292284.1 hypothetical protein MCOR33_009972 [Pyricularia grisea]EHA53047.1 hypothetical protein MGG_05293 [Pyricularia oryzae 70-15]KAH9429825.1 hypothetical protein MCOR02_009558 [Pyricularia oryzae]